MTEKFPVSYQPFFELLFRLSQVLDREPLTDDHLRFILKIKGELPQAETEFSLSTYSLISPRLSGAPMPAVDLVAHHRGTEQTISQLDFGIVAEWLPVEILFEYVGGPNLSLYIPSQNTLHDKNIHAHCWLLGDEGNVLLEVSHDDGNPYVKTMYLYSLEALENPWLFFRGVACSHAELDLLQTTEQRVIALIHEAAQRSARENTYVHKDSVSHHAAKDNADDSSPPDGGER